MQDEIASLLDFVMSVLRAFGFDEFTANLSTKDPNKYVGDDAIWDKATEALACRAGQVRAAVQGQGGRRRLLRAEDRHRRARCDRSHLAAQHDPGRLQPSRAVRPRVRRRRQRPPPTDHVAPRAVRLDRAVLRRAARALRRRVPDVDGTGAGSRAAGCRGPPGARRRGRRPVWQPRASGSTSSTPTISSASGSAPQSSRSCRTCLVVGDDDVAAGTLGVNPRGGEVERGVPLDEFVSRLHAEVDAQLAVT